MKKLVNEYFNIIGYTIVGIVFGICFFLILVNFYHYRDINNVYEKQDSDFNIEQKLKEKLIKIDENSEIDVNQYHGTQDPYSLSSLSSRLSTCSEKINNQEFNDIISLEKVDMTSLYKMQQFYQTNIANECLVKQIYELSSDSNQRINVNTLSLISPFLKNNTNNLIQKTDYVQKILKNNSSYSFTSFSMRSDIYDPIKDSYYELLTDYTNAIDYVYDISMWFQEVIKS